MFSALRRIKNAYCYFHSALPTEFNTQRTTSHLTKIGHKTKECAGFLKTRCGKFRMEKEIGVIPIIVLQVPPRQILSSYS